MTTLKKFHAQLLNDGFSGGITRVDIPFDVENAFNQTGYIKVKGTIDQQSFSGLKLMKKGNVHCLSINQELRKALGKSAGDYVDVTLAPDREELVVPSDLQLALDENHEASIFFETLSESNKNYFIQWIVRAKRAETRATRVQRSIDKLQAGLKFNDQPG